MEHDPFIALKFSCLLNITHNVKVMSEGTWMKISGELILFSAELLEKVKTLREQVKTLQEKVKELEQQKPQQGYDTVY